MSKARHTAESTIILHPPKSCAQIACSPRILDKVADILSSQGVAGEERAVKLVYLVLTTRFLARPVSAVVKGPSSTGKSYVVERVLSFFPPSAYYWLTAMSERLLAYDEEPIKHRFLVICEAAGLGGDMATYLIRSLLSEGKIRYKTVEATKEAGLKPKLIEREGPTGVLLTTTKIRLHPENETRLFSILVNDSPQQTTAIMQATAVHDSADREEIPAEFVELQKWLSKAEHRAKIPFAENLARAIAPKATRLRRDFAALLSLIRAHAILHQAMRGRDSEGRIIATRDDYAAVRELVADLFAEGVEASIPQTIRETVEAVTSILVRKQPTQSVRVNEVAAEIGIDKSAAWRRVQDAIRLGFLVNLEERRSRPALLQLGERLPKDEEILPKPDEVWEQQSSRTGSVNTASREDRN